MRVLFIFLAAFIGQANGISGQNLSFIENKNQWTEAVKFKADIPSGHVYFAKNFFRYVFYNLQDLDRIHEKKHENYIQAYNEKINCYVSFIFS